MACCTTSSSAAFPAEIILDCLEALVHHVCESDDFSQTYATLSSCAQVSRLWHAPAQKVLLTNIELVRRQQALSLFDTLRQNGRGDSVRNLVVGVGKPHSEQRMLDPPLLAELLTTCPNIRKLTVLHHDLPQLPSCLIPSLPHLTDVTIASCGWKSSPRIEVDFLRTLQSVRFLQLPCPEHNRPLPRDVESLSPSFQLFGISTQQYPGPTTNWALRNSSETLQCLTAAYIGDLALCARNHPNLRSLRILTRLAQSPTRSTDLPVVEGLGTFPQLERFEIRDLSVRPPFFRTLPPSIKYLRFWSTQLALELLELIREASGALPSNLRNLQTVIWDWHLPTGGTDDARIEKELNDVMEELRSAYTAVGVDVRLYQRKDGRRPSQAKDLEYEADLRASCYKWFGMRQIPLFDELPTKLPVRAFRDMHSLGLPLAAHFKSLSPFMDSTPGLWSPIFEDCLEGHGDWLERHLPALRQQTTTA
ncbi:hypothetical protein FRB99_004371 [Tulasnella sp. 403]|nr:hypothetical protein FRB99_004371 [Tulasnella sp. 403]